MISWLSNWNMVKNTHLKSKYLMIKLLVMKRKVILTPLLLILVAVLSLTACHKSHSHDSGGDDPVKLFERMMMEQYYYWANIMDNPDPNKHSIESYYAAMLVKEDRWSWMCDGETYRSDQTGVTTSFGLHLKQPIKHFGDYSIYIAYVDKNSPVGQAGVERGWKLTKVANKDALTLVNQGTFFDELAKKSNTFTFLTPEGNEEEFNLTQTSYQSNSLLESKIFTDVEVPVIPAGKKIGYINYLTFNTNLQSEITDAFTQMKSEGIDELILDLRYNGGGSLDVCASVADYLAPTSANNKTFFFI